MTVKQRKPMNGFHERRPRSIQPTRPTTRAQLPRSEEIEGASLELADALGRWHTLIAAEKQQYREAATANAEAVQATADYRAKVRETLTKNGDPSTVKDQTERHKAAAAKRVRFGSDAENERARLAGPIGAMLETEAPTMFEPAEKRIGTAAAKVRGSLAAIREAWADYSHAFNSRLWLSQIHINGGMVPAFHGSTKLPDEVAAALATLDNHIASLAALKSDEAEVQAYRDTEAKAAQYPPTRDVYDAKAKVIRRVRSDA